MFPNTLSIRLLLAFLFLSLVAVGCTASDTSDPVSEAVAEIAPEASSPAPAPEWQPEMRWHVAHDGEAIKSLAFSPDGQILAVGLFPVIELYSASDGDHVRSIELRHSAESLAFSPDGALLGAGQGVYGVSLRDAADGAEIRQLHGGYDNVLAFSPDGQTVATGNREGTAWLWRSEDGELLAQFEQAEADYIVDLAFSPDGSILAVSHFDGALALWDVSNQTILHTLDMPADSGGRVESMAFSPDGRMLVAGGRTDENFKNVARLWNVAGGTSTGVLSGHQNTITSVAFSPDGTMLATGGASRDGSVRLWRVSDWTLLHTLEHVNEDGDPGWVTGVAFSPDGATVAVGTWDGMLYLWQVQPDL
jgi:WD40 repeat protein